MKNKKSIEIDIFDLVNFFWKKKILILSCSIIITALVYYYFEKQTKIYKVQVTIQEPFTTIFNSFYDDSINTVSMSNLLAKNYYDILQQNILSSSNFTNFIKTYDQKGKEFITSLENSKSSSEQYFKKNFGIEDNLKNNGLKIYFNYPENIKGYEILNQYVLKTNITTSENFLKIFKINIELKIKKLENNLELLNNLTNYNIKSELNITPENKIKIDSLHDNIKILETKKKQLTLEKNEIIKNNYFIKNYQPIVQYATKSKVKIFPKTIKITLITFLLTNIILILILILIFLNSKKLIKYK